MTSASSIDRIFDHPESLYILCHITTEVLVYTYDLSRTDVPSWLDYVTIV